MTLADNGYPVYRPFGLFSPKDFKIIWLSNLLSLSVLDEDYSRVASGALNLISTFLLSYSYRLQRNLYDLVLIKISRINY